MTAQDWDAYEYHRKRGRKAKVAVVLLAAGFTAVKLLWIRARRQPVTSPGVRAPIDLEPTGKDS